MMTPEQANVGMAICAAMTFILAPMFTVLSGCTLDDKHMKRTLGLAWVFVIVGIVGMTGIRWHMTGITPWEQYKNLLLLLAVCAAFLGLVRWATGGSR